MIRSEWLEERRKGIGGSDCASLFNIGYGCKRRLFYDKRNIPADFPREESTLMRLGTALEPLFAEIYAEQTGRTVCIKTKPFVSRDIPELRVNVDRTITRKAVEDHQFGLLEIKSVGRGAFYKYKASGLPEDYILQVQHGLLVTGFAFGAFAIGNRDNGDLVYWDVERSDAICKEIAIAAPLFWAQVQNSPMPDALEPDDPRCSRCEYRVTCQGNALIQIETGEMPQVQELAPLVEEYIQRKALFDEAEALIDETAEELKTRLGDKQAVYAGEHKVYFRPQAGRTMYKGEELLKAYRAARTALAWALGKAIPLMEELEPSDPRSVAQQLLRTKFPDLGEPDTFVGKSKPSRPLRIF